MRSKAWLLVSSLLFAALVASHSASALVMTDNRLTISNIQISPTATIDTASSSDFASATANNSLGQADGSFDFSIPAQSQAMVTWAAGHGTADISNLTAHADSSVILPGFANQADSSGLGELVLFFTITGGTGSVPVTISMAIDGLQNAFADAVGIVTRNEIVATLRLFADGVDDPFLFYDNIISGGPSFNQTSAVATTLSKTTTLTYGTSYLIIVDADAESNAMNLPEPLTPALVLVGLALMCWQRRIARKRAEVI